MCTTVYEPGVHVQICGLKWSPCGQQLASGGNDNQLCIWDASFRLVHKVNAHQVGGEDAAWKGEGGGVDEGRESGASMCVCVLASGALALG